MKHLDDTNDNARVSFNLVVEHPKSLLGFLQGVLGHLAEYDEYACRLHSMIDSSFCSFHARENKLMPLMVLIQEKQNET